MAFTKNVPRCSTVADCRKLPNSAIRCGVDQSGGGPGLLLGYEALPAVGHVSNELL